MSKPAVALEHDPVLAALEAAEAREPVELSEAEVAKIERAMARGGEAVSSDEMRRRIEHRKA